MAILFTFHQQWTITVGPRSKFKTTTFRIRTQRHPVFQTVLDRHRFLSSSLSNFLLSSFSLYSFVLLFLPPFSLLSSFLRSLCKLVHPDLHFSQMLYKEWTPRARGSTLDDVNRFKQKASNLILDKKLTKNKWQGHKFHAHFLAHVKPRSDQTRVTVNLKIIKSPGRSAGCKRSAYHNIGVTPLQRSQQWLQD